MISQTWFISRWGCLLFQSEWLLYFILERCAIFISFNREMNGRLELVQQARVRSQVLRQKAGNVKDMIFPAINKENQHPPQQQQHVNNIHFPPPQRGLQSQPPPLSLCEHRNTDDGVSEPSEKNSLSKKIRGPWGTKTRSLLKTVFHDKMGEAQLRQPLGEHQYELKLNTMRLNSIEPPTLGNQLRLKPSKKNICGLGQRRKKSGTILFRERTNSCRIAMKRGGIFPLYPKQSDPLKINEYFDIDNQRLSTIAGDGQNGPELFFSSDSYSGLIL